MKKIIALTLGLLLCGAVVALGDTINVSWDYDGIGDGFRIYDKDNVMVLQIEDIHARTAVIEDTEANNWRIVAYDSTEESGISNSIQWRPKWDGPTGLRIDND